MSERNLDTTNEEHAELEPLGFKGRIGRMRYVAWQFVLTLTMFLTWGLTALIAMASTTASIGVLAISTIILVIVRIRISAQRVHDFDSSAWMLLLYAVPLANLYILILMLVKPGSPSANTYGAPAPPNNTSVKVLFWLAVVLIPLLTIASTALWITGALGTFPTP